ncbi:TRASH domain-containing protein [Acidianus manzaensis]|uniref:TRASH domain-containing protein n=1 Tax=Acidianus manzaensis TaxID=282676 RepID=UPI0011E5AABC|nr:TRASH domain-containing protein [Acidianus manzaensis]
MKLNFKLNQSNTPDKCEHCGAPLDDDAYVLDVNGEKHYFCCSHCADAWKNSENK